MQNGDIGKAQLIDAHLRLVVAIVSTPLVFDSGWDELRANARAISDLAATRGN